MEENDYFYDVEDPNRQSHNKAAQPEGYMNMGLFTFLLIITAGLYGIYLFYKFTKLTNEDRILPQRTPWVQLLLCVFVPFYRWYWFYMTSMRMDNLVRVKTGLQSSTLLTNLLLTLFGLDQICFIILQNSYNKSVGGATGKSPNSTGYAHCKKCGQEFPDDYTHCPYCDTPYQKPFYRKLWFNITAVIAIILAVIILLVVFLPSGSATGEGSASNPGYGYSYTVPEDENGSDEYGFYIPEVPGDGSDSSSDDSESESSPNSGGEFVQTPEYQQA